MMKKYMLKKNKKLLPWYYLNDLDKPMNINIVVSRYNENLDWINNKLFNKYFITCYNKGINNKFNINSPHEIIKLNNVGKCDHTYLYHIVNNYDNLSDYIIFLPGSNNAPYKLRKSRNLINHIEYYKKLVNIGSITEINIKNKFYNFTRNSYLTTDKDNKELNADSKIRISDIRPFGKWYEHHFDNLNVNFHTWWGIFATTREIIHKRPKEFYQKLLDELSDSVNPEVGHYIERAWFAILYSDECEFIDYIYDTV